MNENNQEQGRRYQVELCDLATKENCIICLPTGCGKTFIALSVAKSEYLPKAIAQNKKIIFLANSIPLVFQQAAYFKRHISSSGYGDKAYKEKEHVKAITGAMGTDDWEKGEWDDILDNTDILVMIPEILKKALNHNLVTFDRINLLILDECHNATKSHPMAMIMKDYKHKKENFPNYKLPRVIGLTATIIMGNCSLQKIADEVERMETTMCGRAVTYPEYTEVLPYSTSAQISVTPYKGIPQGTGSLIDTERTILTLLGQTIESIKTNPYAWRDSRRAAMESLNHPDLKTTSQMFNKNKASVIEITKSLSDVSKIFQNDESDDEAMGLGLYAGRLAALQKIAFLKLTNFGGEINNFRLRAEETLRTVVAYCDSILIDVAKAKQIEIFVSAKVKKLYSMLRLWNYTMEKEGKLCGIVFCKERVTAQILSWMFQDASRYNQNFKFIRPAFIVGTSGTTDLEEQKISALKLEETIRKFRDDKVNLIFATSVLEEGLDVPSCNLIVRFDPILTYPSFVQSMGRARSKGAKFLVLTSSNNVTKVFNRIEKFQYYGKALAKYLIENDRSLATDNDKDSSDDDEQLLVNKDDPNSPRITLTSAVQLVYQYCQFLSTDRIVCLEPTSWWNEVGVVDNKIMYKASVALPINAAVRKIIQGKVADNKNVAKRHAFLETCKELYLTGAFDEKLFPVRRGMSRPIKIFLEDMGDDENSETDKNPGSKNNFHWYEKMVADTITNVKIRAGESFKAYRIQLTVLKSTTDSQERENLYRFDEHPHFFAILTQLNLSDIQPFLLYGRYGILKCDFITIDLKGKHGLAAEQVEEIENFQKYVFLDCLKISHPLMSMSNEHHFLISPVIQNANQQWEINWSIMKKASSVNMTDYIKMKSEEERFNNNFSVEEFKNAVVVPWHSQDGIHFYSVCSVQENIKASSSVDGQPNSKSFAGHYFNNYSLKIVNRNQPFLRCAPIGSQLNFLTRKRDDDLLTKGEKKINRDESGFVHLIPEFVNIFPLTASLLIQSQFLPSILHRIQRLMLSRNIYLGVAQTFKWTSALNWKDNNESILKYYDRASPTFGSEARNLFSDSPRKSSSTAEQMWNDASCNSADVIHLDYIHPGEITDSEVEKHRAWKVMGKLNIKQVAKLDFLSKLATRSNYVLPLEKSSQIKFESLDAVTNFQVSPGPSPLDIMEALTLKVANDVLSLENLEHLGDSFLKYCVSTHIFCEFPSADEGNMSELRGKFVSNAHLFKIGSKKQIGEYLAGGIFDPLISSLPPGQKIPSVAGAAAAECDSTFDIITLSKEEIECMSHDQLVSWINTRTEEQSKEKLKKSHSSANCTFSHTRLGDKNISDCVEALIGVYYMNGGQDAALAFMDWMGLRPPDINGQAVKYRRRQPPTCDYNINCGSKSPEDYLPLLDELENLIDYKFTNKWLLVEAFSHPAYIKNTVTGSYNRLEFLGDAVLDFLVTNHIYKNRLRKNPGELTDLRSALVNNVTFGSLAVRYKLHNYLLIISKTLQDAIEKFEIYQSKNGHAVTGHYTLMNDWESPIAMEIEVPKILGDIFESLAGAVFLDSKMSLDRTWTIFYRLMKNEIDEFTRKTPLAPIRELYEKFPNLKFHSLEEQEKSERNGRTNVFVKLNGKKYFGTGTNKKQAKQAAAKYALMCIN